MTILCEISCSNWGAEVERYATQSSILNGTKIVSEEMWLFSKSWFWFSRSSLEIHTQIKYLDSFIMKSLMEEVPPTNSVAKHCLLLKDFQNIWFPFQ